MLPTFEFFNGTDVHHLTVAAQQFVIHHQIITFNISHNTLHTNAMAFVQAMPGELLTIPEDACLMWTPPQSIDSFWFCSKVVSRLAYNGVYHVTLCEAICTLYYFGGIYSELDDCSTCWRPFFFFWASSKRTKVLESKRPRKLRASEKRLTIEKRGKTGPEGNTARHKWF